jgi:hypothetical protein
MHLKSVALLCANNKEVARMPGALSLARQDQGQICESAKVA